ncbi:MAG: sigma 54-interacting transcriptional regulator [Actinomycetota bacterium]
MISVVRTKTDVLQNKSRDRIDDLVPLDTSVEDVCQFSITSTITKGLARLRANLAVDMASLFLLSPDSQHFHLCASDGLPQVNHTVCLGVDDPFANWIVAAGRPVALHDPSPFAQSDLFTGEHFRSVFGTALRLNDRVVGLLCLVARGERRFSEQDGALLELAGDCMALQLDCTSVRQNYRKAQNDLARQHARMRMLLDINNSLVSKLDIGDLFAAISESLRQVTHHRYSQIVLLDHKSNRLKVAAVDFPNGKGLIHEGLEVCFQGSPAGIVYTSREPLLITQLEKEMFPSEITDCLLGEGVRSICLAPLLRHDRALGVISIGRAEGSPFTPSDLTLLSQVADQVAIAIENALAFAQIEELNSRLSKEKQYLEEELRAEGFSNEMVGTSGAMADVMRQVHTVASTYATVLIVGETGTGKDLVAREVHHLSGRREGPFVKLNCAAIPATLLESELFGHAKGAYTGAVCRQIGRLEMADGGTLFLDEIGELPLELQPKLLRVLQDRQFERLGETKTLNVNVRLVAATNRNLAEMVKKNQFRSDLYYRLNVFPISVPSLREHKQDIPALVRYFTAKFSRQLQKHIHTIPKAAMNALLSWHWPGNIRELENLIERAVILSRGPALEIPPIGTVEPVDDSTLHSAERLHILRILQESGGLIGTPQGAAAKLGLKRTTLYAKMKKLGISRNTLRQTTRLE